MAELIVTPGGEKVTPFDPAGWEPKRWCDCTCAATCLDRPHLHLWPRVIAVSDCELCGTPLMRFPAGGWHHASSHYGIRCAKAHPREREPEPRPEPAGQPGYAQGSLFEAVAG